MKKTCVKILSIFFCVAVLIGSITVPAIAADDYTSTIVTWYDYSLYTAHNIADDLPILGNTASSYIGLLSKAVGGTVCPYSTDGYHHATSLSGSLVYDSTTNFVTGKPCGYYKNATCLYCGNEFKYYSSDFAQQASEADTGRQADKVSSAGHIFWQPTWEDLVSGTNTPRFFLYLPTFSDSSCWRTLELCEGVAPEYSRTTYSVTSSKSSNFTVSAGYTYTGGQSVQYGLRAGFSVPCAGNYRRVNSPSFSYSALFQDGNSASGDANWSASSYAFVNSGSSVSVDVKITAKESDGINSVQGKLSQLVYLCSFPYYEVIPSDSISVTDPSSDYSPSGRAGSVTSYYGDVNSHNYTDSSTSIVNESNTTYYNPVTNTTSTIQDWTYDYSDRSYNLTMENGDTVTVTYGDENVTINEGDTIYNIYYVLPSSQIQEPVHEHTWVETSKTEYCTLPGEVIYTCSECGQTMTEETQVLGHTWKIIREVHTHYDEDGNQDQEGYILYECERCGEQYKASSGGTPPGTNVPSGGGAGDSGTSAGLSRVFQNSAAVISQNYGTDGHTGTDCVPAGGGTDVVIAHSEGSVVWVQTGQSNNQGSSGDASYGNCVKIKHSNGYYTLYAHLASVNVSNGQHVYKGQTLGVMGNTGNSYGAHLHFEVRDASDTNINSDPYINADLPDFAGGGTSSGSGSSGNGGGIFSSIGNLIGSLLSGILDIGGAILGKILDALTNLVELITGKLAAVVEAILGIFDEVPQMFGGFLDFLTGMFAFLPPEITTLLIFGIAAIVLIGIIKAVRR